MPIGINDLKQVMQLPGTWDLAYLRQFNNQVETGVKFDELAADIGAGLLAFNESLLASNNYWSRYFSTTNLATVEYDTGGSADELPQLAEHSWGDPVTASATGHMLPLKDYGGALGWTYLALRRAPKERLERNLRAMLELSRNTWEKRIMGRLFSNVADTVGAAGKSAPFADGGVTDANYIPVPYDGETFDNSHNHFFRETADSAGYAAFLIEGAETIRQHGIPGPYDLVIPLVDIPEWTALTTDDGANFIKPQRGIITMQYIAQRAAIDEDEYIGVIEIDRTYFYVRPEARLSSGCAGIFRPMGYNNPMSPLMVRYENGYPLGLSMIANVEHVPFEDAKMMFTFGVGVNNRISGACGSFADSGNYTPPTIS